MGKITVGHSWIVMDHSDQFIMMTLPPGVTAPMRQVVVEIADIPAIVKVMGKRNIYIPSDSECLILISPVWVSKNQDGTYALISDSIAIENEVRGFHAKFICAIEITSHPDYKDTRQVLRSYSKYVGSNRSTMHFSEFLGAFVDGVLKVIAKLQIRNANRRLVSEGFEAALLVFGINLFSKNSYYRTVKRKKKTERGASVSLPSSGGQDETVREVKPQRSMEIKEQSSDHETRSDEPEIVPSQGKLFSDDDPL